MLCIAHDNNNLSNPEARCMQMLLLWQQAGGACCCIYDVYTFIIMLAFASASIHISFYSCHPHQRLLDSLKSRLHWSTAMYTLTTVHHSSEQAYAAATAQVRRA